MAANHNVNLEKHEENAEKEKGCLLEFQPNTVAVNPGRELFWGTTGHHKRMGMGYKKCLKATIGKN